MICKDCGQKKMWLFFDTKGSYWECDCKVDLSNATILPLGMSSFLDERMEWITEAMEDLL